MKTKLSASALKHEEFIRGLLSGHTAADAARQAGYGRKNINVRIVAWELLQRSDIQARLSQLRERATTEAVLTAQQILERLSKIARDGNNPEVIKACRELALIMKLYQTGFNMSVEQHITNVQVVTPRARELTERITGGEGTKRIESGAIENDDIGSQGEDVSAKEVNDER